MKVSAIHNVIGWIYDDMLRVETRKVYEYSTGSKVTVVERRNIRLHLYNKHGLIEKQDVRGEKIDKHT